MLTATLWVSWIFSWTDLSSFQNSHLAIAMVMKLALSFYRIWRRRRYPVWLVSDSWLWRSISQHQHLGYDSLRNAFLNHGFLRSPLSLKKMMTVQFQLRGDTQKSIGLWVQYSEFPRVLFRGICGSLQHPHLGHKQKEGSSLLRGIPIEYCSLLILLAAGLYEVSILRALWGAVVFSFHINHSWTSSEVI